MKNPVPSSLQLERTPNADGTENVTLSVTNMPAPYAQVLAAMLDVVLTKFLSLAGVTGVDMTTYDNQPDKHTTWQNGTQAPLPPAES